MRSGEVRSDQGINATCRLGSQMQSRKVGCDRVESDAKSEDRKRAGIVRCKIGRSEVVRG